MNEINLNEEVERYIEQHKSEFEGYFDIRRIARHFYNLGLNTMYERIKRENREEGHI